MRIQRFQGNDVAEKSPLEARFAQWQAGINQAPDDARWSFWDCELQVAVGEYNRHLGDTPGYEPLDWQFIKAMIWVETGAASPQWKTKPLQIGVPGDPGLNSLLNGNEGGDLILVPEWKARLTANAVTTIPEYNLRAGIGDLLMRLANFAYQSVIPPGATVGEVKVRPGDSLDHIARAQGSTTELMARLNPSVKTLKVGQPLKFEKASTQRVIVSWKTLNPQNAADLYNGGGDSNYARKLDYATNLVRQGKVAICPA